METRKYLDLCSVYERALKYKFWSLRVCHLHNYLIIIDFIDVACNEYDNENEPLVNQFSGQGASEIVCNTQERVLRTAKISEYVSVISPKILRCRLVACACFFKLKVFDIK